MWEPRLWYQPVAPRSGGYRDATATYIRRSEIPLHIYAKHQYRQESEAEAQGNIHSNRKVQIHGHHREWYNIAGIIHYQEIQSIIHEEIYKIKAERCSRYSKRVSRAKQEGNWEEELRWWSKLLLHSDRHGRIRCALWSATARSPRSRLQDLDMRI